MEFKIVTWNMAWWSHKGKIKEAWEFLYDELNTDVALLTEMGDPDKNNCPFQYRKWQNIGLNRLYWGSGIVSRYELRDCYMPPCIGPVMTATLPIDNNPSIRLVSLYGLKDESSNLYTSNLHRYISDLSPILNGKNRSIIIAGDYNADIQLDNRNGNTPNANKIFFDRLNDFGLLDCLAPYMQYPVQTHRHNSDTSFPWQLDHIYATSSVTSKITSTRVINTSQVHELSDHNPIEIIIEI